MTEHYIKAKYEVRLTQSGDCVLYQRDDNCFVFIAEILRADYKDLSDIEALQSIRNNRTVTHTGWTEEAKALIQRALSGDLKPFWTCENKIEENVCTCSIRDLWNFGCQCLKRKENR